MIYWNLWDRAKAVIRGKVIVWVYILKWWKSLKSMT
jgi:hypothetical protein